MRGAVRSDACLTPTVLLNVGETAIPGATDTIGQLRAAGKAGWCGVKLCRLSQAHMKWPRYAAGGLISRASESPPVREALTAHIAGAGRRGRWGVMINPALIWGKLGDAHCKNGSWMTVADTYAGRKMRFLLVGADGWTRAGGRLLEASLETRPRSGAVGNPDLVAPRETGAVAGPNRAGLAHRLAGSHGRGTPVFLGSRSGRSLSIALARFNWCDLAPRVC